jgi:flagellar hook-basal body complex protein FliE
MASPISAAGAYAKLARITDPSASVGGLGNLGKIAGGGDAQGSFGSLVKDALSGVAAAGKKSDGLAQSMAAGKANVVDVVTAVTETEVAIESLVSVRDKVIQAYEEIMRMPI